MKNILTIALGFAALLSFAQQDSISMKYASTITAEDLRGHLEILASDAFEGRETGEPGCERAAAYISDYFKELGIPPCVDGSYYQKYPLKRESSSASTMKVGDKEFKFLDDFFFWLGFDSGELKPTDVVFMGYGIDSENYNDYATEVDLKGKMVIALEGEPFNGEALSMVTKTEKVSDWASEWRLKRDAAQERGAIGFLMVKDNYKNYLGRVKYYLETPGLTLDYPEKRGEEVIPTLFINNDVAKAIMGSSKKKDLAKIEKKIKKKGKSTPMELGSNLVVNVIREKEEIIADNVLAFIEGSDPVLKDEIVIVTAHYDHVGVNKKGEVFNGADDDGSGTVTALEIAQAFKMAKDEGNGTRRSVLVMTVSGEEKGLLGSEWYSEYPVFDLDKTVADLNIDMIGRVDEKHADDSNYIYLIGSDKLSTELHSISESANSTYTNLALDYEFNHPDDPNRFYYRSDHYNFARKGIPVIFYFSGVHEDYHGIGDDPEKILYDKTATIGRLIFHTAWELANRDEKIVVDVENEFAD
jgi:hypothetical protein